MQVDKTVIIMISLIMQDNNFLKLHFITLHFLAV